MPLPQIRLMGSHEIRLLLGVSRQRTFKITSQPDFPKEIAELAQGKIWRAEDVEAWIRANRPRKKEPPRRRGPGKLAPRDDDEADFF